MLTQWIETHSYHDNSGLEKDYFVGTSLSVLLVGEGNYRIRPENQQGDHGELQGRGWERRHQNIRQVCRPAHDPQPAQVHQRHQDSRQGQSADLQQPGLHIQKEEEVRHCPEKRDLRSVDWISLDELTGKLIKIRHNPNIPEQSCHSELNEQTLESNLINNEMPKVRIKDIKRGDKADSLSPTTIELTTEEKAWVETLLWTLYEDDY